MINSGAHAASNALACLGGEPIALGLDLARAAFCAGALATAPAGRGLRQTILLDPNRKEASFTLIDECVQKCQSGHSMAAALALLAENQILPDGRAALLQFWATCWKILDLGPEQNRAMHAALAEDPSMADIRLVHCSWRAHERHFHAAVAPAPAAVVGVPQCRGAARSRS